jgi:TatD DNase family protein
MTSEMQWCDNHCHLGYGDTIGALDAVRAVVERARAAGVTRMITVGTDRTHSEEQIAIANAFDDVWATVGLHPHDASNGVDTIIDLFDRPRVVAVGECGLDYHYDHSPRDVQRRAFAAQIDLAHARALPLVIHTREAWDDTFAILDAHGMPSTTIFHCFTGDAMQARSCLDRGAYLSFSGIVTFKTATDVREAAALCPVDRLLIETDSPYLAPVPHRGRRNEPAYLPLVGACLAEVRHTAVEDLAYHSFFNATVAFHLAPS